MPWLAGLVLLACFGCTNRSTVQGQLIPGLVEGNGAEIETLDKVGVGCPSGKKAKLILAGDPIDVQLSCTEKSGSVDIKLTSHDALFEEEQYRTTSAGFELVNAAGESYEPPVLLVRAPMHVGDKWTWSGQMKSGDVPHVARATITTSKERVFPPTAAPADALKVEVDFEIEGGGPSPAKRRLLFWFAQNQGVIKRQFGETSIREPAGP